jgi:hypothetical protein
MAIDRETVLDRCIDRIMGGEYAPEEWLAEYPLLREEIRPLLELALEFREKPTAAMSTGARARIRQEIPQAISAEGNTRRSRWDRMRVVFLSRASKGLAFAGAAIAILLIVALAGTGVAYASQGSIPGDALYPVKRGLERVRLSLARDEGTQGRVHLTFADRRMEEATLMVKQGRAEALEDSLGDYVRELEVASQVAGGESSGTEVQREPAGKELSTLVAEATAHHIQVLERVLGDAPEAAKPGLERALAASQKGHKRVSKALERRGRSEGVPKGPPPSVPRGPKEVSEQSPVPEAGETMHVAAIGVRYEQRGPNYTVHASVTIADRNGERVSGATVQVRIGLPDGSISSQSGHTGGDGMVTFRVRSGQQGTYTSVVMDVLKEGWSYDSVASMETSESLSVP